MTTIRGQVVGPDDRPVAEAAVYIISAPARMPDIAQLTDNEGWFTVGAPLPGLYTIGARSDKWGTAQTEVEVGEEPVTVELRFDTPKEVGK